ncbi:cytochrome c oxidase accessory protein CcoG [Amphritea japonica]|uniref:Iron-sulfur protein n=1 Tax=Amphritea japonica ATCC BAA-1530 TaxID=1278309 RepID=A0A7R6P7P5_9GAMM|nr:cytochrome c oxidase accessory protein CcoG [Amphritea japonica]BBB27444.1 iron-sulfur protein [Amphritea japonica ATCC BAA-1530]
MTQRIPVRQDPTPPFATDGKFHVRLIEGYFQNLRRLTTWPLITLYFALAWVQIDGQPVLFFSFELRRIHLFGSVLSWHDLPLLAGLMIAGSTLLFFVAVAWGRVWCGFACPQSIWTWLFIRIEQLTEGRANERARYDGSFKGVRLFRRLLKHGLWVLLALGTAVTFTGYFVPIREIVMDGINLQLSITMMSWLLIMTALTYTNAGLVREKICLHACPYSRFQSVMFDQHTLSVSYDTRRGEPRAQYRNADENSGDCVDCGVCVQVCPTGIDIRDGLQAACIDCAACIDGCNTVMDKLSRPRGLIRFASEQQLKGFTSPKLRMKLLGYGVIMLSAITAVVYGFTETKSLLIEIQRDRTELFTRVEPNRLCNQYRVKVEGFSDEIDIVQVSLSDPSRFQLHGPTNIDLRESSSTWLPFRICSSYTSPAGATLDFVFTAKGVSATKTTTFLTQRL